MQISWLPVCGGERVPRYPDGGECDTVALPHRQPPHIHVLLVVQGPVIACTVVSLSCFPPFHGLLVLLFAFALPTNHHHHHLHHQLLMLCSLFPFTSLIACGSTITQHNNHQVLNAIQYGAYRGQGSNMMSVPTDCDQRDERLGWMGGWSLVLNATRMAHAANPQCVARCLRVMCSVCVCVLKVCGTFGRRQGQTLLVSACSATRCLAVRRWLCNQLRHGRVYAQLPSQHG